MGQSLLCSQHKCKLSLHKKQLVSMYGLDQANNTNLRLYVWPLWVIQLEKGSSGGMETKAYIRLILSPI